MLNLCELVALRPDVSAARKIVYFHENQLTYPARHEKERDFHLSWMQGAARSLTLLSAVLSVRDGLGAPRSFKRPRGRPSAIQLIVQPVLVPQRN